MSEIPKKAIEVEIVEEEFLAPTLQNAKELTTLVNTDDLIRRYGELANISTDTPVDELAENFIEIEKGFKAFRKARTSLERRRKEIGEPAYRFHKKVIEIAKEVQKTINPYENKLEALVRKVENEEKRKQAEAEEAEEKRIENIKGLIADTKNLPLQHFNSSVSELTKTLESLRVVTKEVYEEFYDEAVENQNYVISQLQTARDNKILVENAEKLKAEADAKAKAEEAERQALRDAEQKKLDDERAEFEIQKAKFEAQQRVIQEEKDRAIAEREADELMKRQEAERVEREKMQEAERVERERAEKAQREQQAKINKERHDEMVKETMAVLNTYTDMVILIDDIIDGAIPNVKWVQDE